MNNKHEIDFSVFLETLFYNFLKGIEILFLE